MGHLKKNLLNTCTNSKFKSQTHTRAENTPIMMSNCRRYALQLMVLFQSASAATQQFPQSPTAFLSILRKQEVDKGGVHEATATAISNEIEKPTAIVDKKEKVEKISLLSKSKKIEKQAGMDKLEKEGKKAFPKFHRGKSVQANMAKSSNSNKIKNSNKIEKREKMGELLPKVCEEFRTILIEDLRMLLPSKNFCTSTRLRLVRFFLKQLKMKLCFSKFGNRQFPENEDKRICMKADISDLKEEIKQWKKEKVLDAFKKFTKKNKIVEEIK